MHNIPLLYLKLQNWDPAFCSGKMRRIGLDTCEACAPSDHGQLVQYTTVLESSINIIYTVAVFLEIGHCNVAFMLYFINEHQTMLCLFTVIMLHIQSYLSHNEVCSDCFALFTLITIINEYNKCYSMVFYCYIFILQ